MSDMLYTFSESHEWHGIFSIIINDKEFLAGGTLIYKPDSLFAADVIPIGDFPFKIENEQKVPIYARLIDKNSGDLLHVTLLDCFMFKIKNVFNRKSGASTSLKLIPNTALFAGAFLNPQTDIIQSVDVEYNVWPEFAYPQGFKSSKPFEPLHWKIDLKDQFSLSSCESVTGHSLEADFDAGSVFVGGEKSDLQQISDALKPILKEKGTRVMFKDSDSHRWYLKFKQEEGNEKNKDLSGYREKIWALCQLLYCLTHDKKTAPLRITLHSKQADEPYTQSSAVLYSWSGIKNKISYRNLSDVLFMQKIGEDGLKNIFRQYFEKYEKLSSFLDVFYHNNTEDAFNVFQVSRIIDCWAVVVGAKGLVKVKKDEKSKYQMLFEWWADGDNGLITKTEQLLGVTKAEIGEKISNLRSMIVHFTPGAPIHNVMDYFKAYCFLELVVIDYIFEEIGLSSELRKEYKMRYLS